ncbi:hypothetical protein BWK63_13140 [Flavobacterium covae]|uniref:Lipoprotein n=1 Tax=Flavobacterium covae TaxID=2906076 RepID=A0ABW8PKV4_9FLAO|nr:MULTISPECIES: hypothetical protein [Flavobacterium]OWP80035.1 hypothetical protein BWK63_13140 [Flavobacterium covae]POR20604.1 hypothetical protein BWK57_12995 [Flavobacterium columnare]
MKKILLLTGLLAITSSCTYEEVMAFINGQPNNLTEAEKQNVRKAQESGLTLEDKDKGGIIIPPH